MASERRGTINGYPYRAMADGRVVVETGAGERSFADFAECEKTTAEWAAIHPAAATAAAGDSKVSRNSGGFVILALICAAVWFFWPQGGFSDEEIAAVKSSIREKWSQQKGVKVDDVVMVRESDHNKLTGYVLLRFDGLAEPISKPCTATHGGKEYIWQCR